MLVPKSIHHFKSYQQSARLFLLFISTGLAPGAINISPLQGLYFKINFCE